MLIDLQLYLDVHPEDYQMKKTFDKYLEMYKKSEETIKNIESVSSKSSENVKKRAALRSELEGKRDEETKPDPILRPPSKRMGV